MGRYWSRTPTFVPKDEKYYLAVEYAVQHIKRRGMYRSTMAAMREAAKKFGYPNQSAFCRTVLVDVSNGDDAIRKKLREEKENAGGY